MIELYTTAREVFATVFAIVKTTITRTPVTKTVSGYDGEEIETDGTPVSIYAYVQAGVKSKKLPTETGQVSDIDLKIMVPYTQAIGTSDKFAYQSDTYQVKVKEDLNEVYVQGYLIYTVVNLYRLS